MFEDINNPPHQQPNLSLEARVAVLESQLRTLLHQFNNLDSIFPPIKEVSNLETKVAVLEAEMATLQSKVDKKVDKNEFWPVKSVVYAMVALILMAVGSAMIYGIIPTAATKVSH